MDWVLSGDQQNLPQASNSAYGKGSDNRSSESRKLCHSECSIADAHEVG